MAERAREFHVDRGTKESLIRDLLLLALYLLAVAAVAAIGSIATGRGQDWYDGLEKPAFNPPGATFGIVWTALYVAIAVAAWLVHRSGNAKPALAAWWVQLGLNLAWSWVFFGAEQPLAGLIEIAVLAVAVAATMVMFFQRNTLAGLLFVPYLGWVLFASVLNFEIWRLN